VTSNQNPPSLNDFWNINAYFERSHYTTPVDLQEPDPFPNPSGTNPNTVYTYYRQKASHDGIGLAISNDGGATYSLGNNGNMVVPPGSDPCAWDAGNVVMPSVVGVAVAGQFFMVYEGASIIANVASCTATGHYMTVGDIGMATSPDGITWTKYNGNGLFLKHNIVTTWQCNNIGGPSVNYFNGQFYIFFHGDCGIPTDAATVAVCVGVGLPGLVCAYGVTPCALASNCPYLFRFDGLRNKAGMVHAVGTDLKALQGSLQSSVNSASPLMDIGVGAYSWDSRVNGRPNVIYEGGYYYLFFEGAQYVYCKTYPDGLPVVGGKGANEGNWGWGVARTLDINSNSWEKFAYNPIQQLFRNGGTGCGTQQPYVFQVNGATWVYYWSTSNRGQSDVLLWGTDPYLHIYPAINGGFGQCEQPTFHKIGFPDGDGWAQGTNVGADRLCYGPYQSISNSNDYSHSLWNTWTSNGGGAIPAGNYAATFRSMIDSTNCSGDFPPGVCAQIIMQDVTHSSGTAQDSSITASRNDYQANYGYQNFEQQFPAVSGQSYEWRTWWYSHAYTRLHDTVLRQLDGTYDNTVPTASMNSLLGNSGLPLTVSWSGSDTETGIWSFDVQYQVNGGGWNPWQMGTPSTSASVSQATCFNTYGFQVRARDFSGNLGGYSGTVSTYIACDFSVSAIPTSVTVNAQTPGTSTITVTPINGYPDTVNLSADNGCSLSPASVIASGLSTLSCSFSTYGTYTVTVTGSGDGLSHQASVTFTVQDFAVTAAPASFTLNAGDTGTSTITVSSLNGFAGQVSLAYSIPPSSGSLACTLTPTIITGSGASTLSCSGSYGTYVVTVTGTSGNLSHSKQVTYIVQDFAISSSPNSFTIPAGSPGSSTITVTALNGFSGTVSLTASVSPTGLTCTLAPTSIAGSGTSILQCSGSAGIYNVIVGGTSGSLASGTPVKVTVQDFSMFANPGTVNIQQGASGSSIITVGSLYGFSGTVTLSTSAPSGITATLNATSVLLSSGGTRYVLLSISVGPGTVIGNYGVSVTGNSAPLSHMTSAVVQASNFSVSITPLSIVIPVGGSGSVTITASSLNGYSGPVSFFLVSGMPSCVSYSLVPLSGPLPSGGSVSAILTMNPPTTCPTSTNSVSVGANSGTTGMATSFSLSIPDFTLNASPTSVTVYGNNVGASILSVTPLNGFTGTVTLSLSLSPSTGLTCYFSSGTITGSANSGLYCYGAVGTYTASVTGTSGLQAHAAQVVFAVRDFTLTVTPTSINIPDARSGTVTVQATSLKGYTGTITLSYYAPYCATSSFSKPTLQLSPGSDSATLTVNIPATCNANTYGTSVGGYDGVAGFSRSASLTVVTSDFYIGPQISTTFGIGGKMTLPYNVTYYSENNYPTASITQTAAFGANNCCLGASWNALVTLPQGGNTLTVWSIKSSGKSVGATTLTFTATDGYITRSLTLSITINDYNVTYWYNPLSVTRGSGSAIYLQIFPEYGISLTGATVTAVTVPSCITVSPPNPQYFNIGPIGGYDFPTVPVAAASTCTLGNYQVTVQISGVTNHAYDKLLTFTVTVVPPPPSGGGGGSIAYGSLITMADGSKVAVQNLKVGDQMLGYNPVTGQWGVSVITAIKVVSTSNMLIIHTASGTPFRVDANPAQTLWVKTAGGTIGWLSVTLIKPGDYLYTANGWTPVTSIEFAPSGNHVMYDITSTLPYFADGYLDPIVKL
jgi:hypothetical protein